MASDLQLVAGQALEEITFQINKSDGSPDDLTAYANVRLKIARQDFSANVYNVTQADAEIDSSQFSLGIVKWIPSIARPVPVFGFYWLQIIREKTGVTDPAPVQKYFLEIVRSVP